MLTLTIQVNIYSRFILLVNFILFILMCTLILSFLWSFLVYNTWQCLYIFHILQCVSGLCHWECLEAGPSKSLNSSERIAYWVKVVQLESEGTWVKPYLVLG